MNADNLGSRSEIEQLVNQIQSFDVEYATPAENMALARALKVVALDIVRQHQEASALREKMCEHLKIAEVSAELAGVIDIIRPNNATPVTQEVTREATGRRSMFGWFGGRDG